MIVGSIPVLPPQAHRRIDQLAFPALLATAALMSRWDRKVGAVALMTVAVEGTAHLVTAYPPGALPWIGFRAHNRWAPAHGVFVAEPALSLPVISRRNRWALYALGAMPIALAALSDTRQS